ncbi:MAG: response regulator [Candidatus Methylomirabilales bacterium]
MRDKLPCGKGKTLLVVEDSPSNLELLRELFQSLGFEVLTASTANEGLKVLTLCRPDLILLDIQLPSTNGLQFARHLKEDPRTNHIPIIAVTALAMEGDRERILAAGCDGYIPKPTDLQILLEEVARHLSKEREDGSQC